jgi:hypothetical protein
MKEKQLYTIVHGKSTSDLSEKVNKEYLKFGWKLQGGVCAGKLEDGSEILYQAVCQIVSPIRDIEGKKLQHK